MKALSKGNQTALKRFWRIALILLLNLLILSAIVYPFTMQETVQTLSKRGSRGDEVKQIQSKLRELGLYKGNVDSIFGEQTEKAVKAFQKQCGLTVDGIAGPKTLLYLGITNSSASSGGSSGSFNNNDVNLLAKIISAEARGEPYSGQVAVGAVVLNRVEHASFPDTVAGVVYQPGAFTAVRDSNWAQPVAESATRAARDALNGSDPSGGAIYYFNPAKTSNRWIRTRPVITQIGTHLFCS